MNYTHILSVRIWNHEVQCDIKDVNLDNSIKTLFLEKEQTYNGVKIVWRKKELTPLEKAFDKGDIVIDSPFGYDEILLAATRETFIDINKYMHENKLLSEDYIATFTIMKPLTRRIPLVETAGYIYDF